MTQISEIVFMVYHKGVSQETFMSCPMHTHTAQPRKIMREGKLQFVSVRAPVSFMTFIPMKTFSLCISMCMAILSPLGDTVSAWNPELEWQEPFSTGKVMWKKIAPAPAYTILVSSDFCTIQSCLLKDSNPPNLNTSAVAGITHAIRGVSKAAGMVCVCICLYIHSYLLVCLALFTNITRPKTAKQFAALGKSVLQWIKFSAGVG